MRTRLFLVGLACACVGCETAFERNPAYGKRPAERAPVAVRKPVAEAKRLPETQSLSDTYRPLADRPDIKAEYACAVERPADAALSGLVDECLEVAYRHSRGEERKGIAATGAAGMRDAFFADYREWFAEDGAAVTNGEMSAHVASWSCTVEGRIAFCDERHFSYRVTIDTMTGGAHPNRWVQNATYSRKDGRRLAVADVVRRSDMTDTVNQIRKALRRKAHGDVSLQAQLRDEIRLPYDEYVREIRDGKREAWGNPLVTDNFMLTRDGVVWTYNQYEIACYASGWFDALVPWAALKTPQAQMP